MLMSISEQIFKFARTPLGDLIVYILRYTFFQVVTCNKNQGNRQEVNQIHFHLGNGKVI